MMLMEDGIGKWSAMMIKLFPIVDLQHKMVGTWSFFKSFQNKMVAT
jgi:hypothetical protein